MSSGFYRKLGSLLGLLAILMATLAPTVSHTLAFTFSHTLAVNSDESGESDMPGERCSMPSMHAPAPDDKPGSHSQMSDGQDCGYCSLLAHMPAVPSVRALFAVTVRLTQHTVATRFESVRRVEPLSSAPPRAPPVSS